MTGWGKASNSKSASVKWVDGLCYLENLHILSVAISESGPCLSLFDTVLQEKSLQFPENCQQNISRRRLRLEVFLAEAETVSTAVLVFGCGLMSVRACFIPCKLQE
jgi:hypothetical protein